MLITLLPCKAQLLQTNIVQIELMDGTIRKAELYSYTNEGLIVYPIVRDTVKNKMDTISYITIEKISMLKIKHPYIYTVGGSIIGYITGAAIALSNTDPYRSGLTDIFEAITSSIGCCFGFTTGYIVDVARRRKTIIIHAEKFRFDAFVTKNKK